MRNLVISFLFIFLGSPIYGTDKFAFLKISPNTRAEALGTATTASTFSFSDLYSNPASLCQLKNTSFTSTLADWIENITYSHIAFGINSNQLFGSSTTTQKRAKVRSRSSSAFAVSITTLSAKLEKRNDNGDIIGDFGVGNYALGLSYALGVQNLSYGLTLKTLLDKIDDNTTENCCLDAGLLYEIPVGILPLPPEYIPNYAGITLMNLGTGTPTNFTTGIAYVIPTDGVVNKIIASSDFLFAISGSNGFSIGVETEIEKMFFVRAGYRNAFQSYRSGISFGAGFVTSKISYLNLLRIDYAYSLASLQNIQKFSLSLEF